MNRSKLKPRDILPTMEDTDTMSWWRGYWAGAPLWLTLGAAIAVILIKR